MIALDGIGLLLRKTMAVLPSTVPADDAPASPTKKRMNFQWLWPVVVAVLVVSASGRSHVAGPDVVGIDKVTHFAVYGLLATLICRLGKGPRGWFGAAFVASFFGITDEWHQSFVPGRSVEFADWVADTLGALLAVTLYTKWHAYRRLLEFPLWGRAKARGTQSEEPSG